MRLINKIKIQKIILFYFYFFLFLDLLNGLTLRYLALNPILSPGQIVRSIILLILTINFLFTNRFTKNNIHILLFIAIFPAALIIYLIRDGLVHSMATEIIWFMKPLFFLLLLDFVYSNRYFFKIKLSSIMKANLFIYAIPIIFSAYTGFGLSNYEDFYSSTKGFFYGNNATSIIGFILCIYFVYQIRLAKIHYLYFIIAFMSLYLSGGKIILVVPFLSLLIHLFYNNKKILTKLSYTLVILFFTILFITGITNPNIFINNTFTQKYYSRAFNELLISHDSREKINYPLLRWYSYLSITRAYRANDALNSIIDQPENLLFGFGAHNRPQKYKYIKGTVFTVEMDIFDMFVTWGMIGFLLIYIPIIKTIIQLLFSNKSGMIAMIVYLLFLYSSLAGHVLTTPMASSLFALFLGISLIDNKIVKELI